MNDYVLLTFYNRQTTENPSWEVYGHTAPGHNTKLMSFSTRMQAIEYAHSFYTIPVLEGSNKGHVVKKLYDKNEK